MTDRHGRSRPGGSRTIVAALGDSITEGSPGYDSGRGGDEQSQWEYWAARVNPELEFRNCGLYGQRTDEIAARLDACAAEADALIVQGGINDIAQGRDVEAAAKNLRAMVRRGREVGLRVYLADVLPWNNGWPGAESEIRRLNALVHSLAEAERVPLLRFHDALEDPERPGRMRDDWTSDGDHPSIAGYRVLGELVAQTLSSSPS